MVPPIVSQGVFMRQIALVFASLALPVALHAADTEANNYWLRVQANAWMPALQGEARFQSNGSPADNIDMEDLNLTDAEVVPMIDVYIKPPIFFIPNFHFGVFTFAVDETATLSSSVTFGGTTFTGGTTVTSEVDLADAYAEMFFMPLDLDLVGLGFGLGVHGLQTDISIDDGTVREKFATDVIFPVISLHAHLNLLDSLGLEVEANGIDAEVGGIDGSFYDVRAQLSWRPINWVGINAGYRAMRLDAAIEEDQDEASFDITLSGPYAGLLLQF